MRVEGVEDAVGGSLELSTHWALNLHLSLSDLLSMGNSFAAFGLETSEMVFVEAVAREGVFPVQKVQDLMSQTVLEVHLSSRLWSRISRHGVAGMVCPAS